MRPTLSVVIPAFDAERFVEDAIETARAQQPCPDEIVVVDDGSRDATAARAEATGAARVLREPHGGGARARNLGLAAARGELLALLDVDDLWLPGKLAAQLAVLAAEPDLGGVFTGIRNQFTSDEVAARFGAPAGALRGVCASTLVLRRAAWEEAGPFDESARRTDFMEWYARARERGVRFRVLEPVYAVRRIHGANASIRRRRESGEYVSLARQLIERRRAARSSRHDGEGDG